MSELLRDVPGRGPEDHEPGALRTHNLTARGEVFRKIVQAPEIISCMEHLLGADCILCDAGARSPMPGIPQQNLHRYRQNSHRLASWI